MIYLLIFILKLIENMLSTLRLIVIAHGKKLFGAFLQLVYSLFFIISTSIVVIDIQKDIFKLIVFGMGSFIGSYLGSVVEEKIYKKKTVKRYESSKY